MRSVIVLALVACGGAPVKPVPAHPPALADLSWLVGSWHADRLDQHFVAGGGSIWGVMLYDGGFEVVELREHEGRLEMFALPEGRDPLTLPAVSAAPDRIELGGTDRVRLARTGATLHGEFQHADAAPQGYDATRMTDTHVADLETAELAFAADSAAAGAVAWGRAFAPDGALWRGGQRVEGGDAIAAAVAQTLAKGALAWKPIASAARGDWGYTVGTYVFTPVGGGKVATGSYCTIWKRVDGKWRVAFDLGN